MQRFSGYGLYSVKTFKTYFPGVIGAKYIGKDETRFLVFSDYGQTQYIEKSHLKVLKSSEDVSRDVHQNLKRIIKRYLAIDSSIRATIKLEVGRNVSEFDQSNIIRYATVLCSNSFLPTPQFIIGTENGSIEVLSGLFQFCNSILKILNIPRSTLKLKTKCWNSMFCNLYCMFEYVAMF